MDPREASIYSAVVITGLVLVCVIIYFIYSVSRHQRRFIELHRKYFLNEVALLEKERGRIAKDLHDELGPLVSVSKMHLEVAVARQPDSSGHIEKATEKLDQLMLRMGEITNDLTPRMLEQYGLKAILHELFTDLKETGKLHIQYSYKGEAMIEKGISIHMYRIIKELVHNCVRHSGASQLSIAITEKSRWLVVDYKDDGTGFDIERLMESSKGFGLSSIKSRTEMLGGRLRYASKPGVGTSYLIELPINENK